ncbi:unnamed protein product [Camellia sinensis]
MICCAMLPTIVRHRNHKHLRILRYSPVEGEVEDPDQYICDICEYFRNPMHWFYCAECNFTAHLDCAEIRGSTSSLVAPPMNMSLIHTLSLWLK